MDRWIGHSRVYMPRGTEREESGRGIMCARMCAREREHRRRERRRTVLFVTEAGPFWHLTYKEVPDQGIGYLIDRRRDTCIRVQFGP